MFFPNSARVGRGFLIFNITILDMFPSCIFTLYLWVSVYRKFIREYYISRDLPNAGKLKPYAVKSTFLAYRNGFCILKTAELSGS
jgi:hypothetical protein